MHPPDWLIWTLSLGGILGTMVPLFAILAYQIWKSRHERRP